jgi:hypothetical protein
MFPGERAHQARIAEGGLRLLRRDAAVGQGLVRLQEVELLGLPVALGLGSRGGRIVLRSS